MLDIGNIAHGNVTMFTYIDSDQMLHVKSNNSISV